MHVDHAREQMHSELLTWKERERENHVREVPPPGNALLLHPRSPLLFSVGIYISRIRQDGRSS